jgi:hypothetical protein
MVVKTVRENTVYTKRAPVIKAESLINNETDDVVDVNIDTTKEADVEGVVPAEVLPEIAPEVVVEGAASEETK